MTEPPPKPPKPSKAATKFDEVRLHSYLWQRATEHQKREWEVLLRELRDEDGLQLAQDPGRPDAEPVKPDTLELRLTTEALEIRRVAADGTRNAVGALALKELEVQLAEYQGIVQRMQDASNLGDFRRLETLDLAKALCHDQGADRVQRLMKGVLDLDFPAARRLFTVVCTLWGEKAGS